jgi:hypothetical protein
MGAEGEVKLKKRAMCATAQLVVLYFAPFSPFKRMYTSQARINVWYPSNVSMSIDDAVLNSVLPINAAPPSSGCLDGFQSARLSATADWSDGASVLHNADVTALLSYVSSDPNVAQVVQGAIVKARCTAAHGLMLAPCGASAKPRCILVLTPPHTHTHHHHHLHETT